MLDITLAVLLDWIVGDPRWFPHPVIYIGKLIKLLENLSRKHCKTDGALKVAGGLIVITICALSFLIPFGLLKLTEGFNILNHIVNVLIIWTTLAARSLHVEGKKVYYSLEKEDLSDARIKLSYIVGRDTNNLSEKEIIRADVETIAENTSDGIIAPLLFAAIGGAPLAMLYKGVNTMDSMLGYMNEKYRYIGFFPAKVDDVFNFIPARVTGIIMCLSSLSVGGNIIGSFKIMFRDRKNHKSPNCGYPEAAAAGAMRIQLGGTNMYFGEAVEKPTIGDKIKEINLNHINDCIKLMYATEIVVLALVSVVKL
jgi:adenosylcobinamide-phosphate synthase